MALHKSTFGEADNHGEIGWVTILVQPYVGE